MSTATGPNASDQAAKAEAFGALHRGERPLLLANAWDRTSARLLERAGAQAIGTTSAGIAYDNGYHDGEQMPWPDVVAVFRSIAGAVSVPVTADIEAGRGPSAADVGRRVAEVVEVGVVGVNIEDSLPGGGGQLFAVEDQCQRLAAARRAADTAGVPLYVNARCDVWFGAKLDGSDPLAVAVERARAYLDAGASGLFVPGLLDVEVLTQLTAQVDAPVNVMVFPGAPPYAELAAAGVRRLSQGVWAFCSMLTAVERVARQYVVDGSYGGPEDEPAWAALGDLVG